MNMFNRGLILLVDITGEGISEKSECETHGDLVQASYGGEDAHFVSSTSLAFGVADGVGGWSADGINPAGDAV